MAYRRFPGHTGVDLILALARHTFGVCLRASIGAIAFAAEGWAGDDGSHESAGNQLYWAEQVAEGLSFPSAMVWLPTGEMLITERMGGLRLLCAGKIEASPISGMPVSLQSMRPMVSPSIQIFRPIECSTCSSQRARCSENTPQFIGRTLLPAALRMWSASFRSKDDISGVITTATTRMIFLADKTLLFAVPEDSMGGSDKQQAQKLDSHIGRILRISRDGTIPRDNPFLNSPAALPEIWSYGHRVPLGFYQSSGLAPASPCGHC